MDVTWSCCSSHRNRTSSPRSSLPRHVLPFNDKTARQIYSQLIHPFLYGNNSLTANSSSLHLSFSIDFTASVARMNVICLCLLVVG